MERRSTSWVQLRLASWAAVLARAQNTRGPAPVCHASEAELGTRQLQPGGGRAHCHWLNSNCMHGAPMPAVLGWQSPRGLAVPVCWHSPYAWPPCSCFMDLQQRRGRARKQAGPSRGELPLSRLPAPGRPYAHLPACPRRCSAQPRPGPRIGGSASPARGAGLAGLPLSVSGAFFVEPDSSMCSLPGPALKLGLRSQRCARRPLPRHLSLGCRWRHQTLPVAGSTPHHAGSRPPSQVRWVARALDAQHGAAELVLRRQ